ncbi:hypothetical protein CDAR_34381 [Caerostris darwini]|uniref:Uncharacterized protein n=1 Tax=Caerostris darwini TaxID=1538125 RepID=A0AAV4UZD0_9ARAC|nr:hypothetical protein CDAR_34381 [Caerostris darwini]
MEFYVFCDAKLKGYGAVAHFRDPDLCSTSFVLEKIHVSPLTKQTLPCLELMGDFSYQFTPFVAKRVCEIQDQVSPSQWTYSKGTENPADSVSRGLATSNIYNKSLSVPWSNMVEEGNLQTSQFDPENLKIRKKSSRAVVKSSLFCF